MPPPPVGLRAAQQAERTARREEAVRLSVAGFTYEEIAERLGYNSRQAAYRDVKAALAERIKSLGLAADELIAKHELLIEQAIKTAHEIMNKDHYAHSQGRLVRREVELEDGSVVFQDVYDDAPRLAAGAQLIRASESLRKLRGLDAPSRTEVTGTQTVEYKINATPDELDAL